MLGRDWGICLIFLQCQCDWQHKIYTSLLLLKKHRSASWFHVCGRFLTFPFWICYDETIKYCSFRRENLLFGTAQFHWLLQGRDICVSQVSVAADYSDSVPDSSSYATSNGYHPLEELKDHGRARDTMPSSAEIARTAVEVSLQYMIYINPQIKYLVLQYPKILTIQWYVWFILPGSRIHHQISLFS